MSASLEKAIELLTSEIANLREEVEKLREANIETNAKLYLTNEYLSTLDKN